MLDQYNRDIDYLRISLTDRCNLRCIYCMPEDGIQLISHEDILSFEEIVRICQSMASLGIRKVKLTGGEPLLRKNLSNLVGQLKHIPGIEKVTLTTNGILLKEQLPDLVAAGLDAVNISLDTLDEKQFERIARRNQLNAVLEGIEAAARIPHWSVKINCVPVEQTPETFVALAGIAKKMPVHVRFIEMMPIGYGKEFPFQSERDILSLLESVYGPAKTVHEHFGNGPCHYYEIQGFQGKIGFISAMTHKYCTSCNRIRLTAEGYLKACLQYQNGKDLRLLLRSGISEEALSEVIREVIWNKPVSHQFEQQSLEKEEKRIMSQIGG